MAGLEIIPPVYAGKVYPSDKLNLEREISLYLETANTDSDIGHLKGLIVPFGDYRMVGGVMARSFVHLIGTKYKKILIMAPALRQQLSGVATYNGDGFQTPLGIIPINKAARRKLTENFKHDDYFSSTSSLEPEAGLECPLPFLQSILGNILVLPLLIGNITPEKVHAISLKLHRILQEEEMLLLLSVNLSVGKPYDKVRSRDEKLLACLRESNLEGLFRENEKDKYQDNNLSSLALFMKTIHQFSGLKLDVLTYRNSTDIDGNREKSAGYFAAVLHQ